MSPRRNHRRWHRRVQDVIALRREFAKQHKRRAEILRKYASRDENQVPRVCERAGRDGKVIYRSEEAARRAAVELHKHGGARVLEPYLCPWLDDGREHWHLRTRADAG